MSRKALFTNLNHPLKRQPETDAAKDDRAIESRADARPNRLRMRPILGAPDLISDAVATPVGAIGQSLGEFTAKAKRAEEIERKLAEGLAIVDLDPALIDPSFVVDRMPATGETQGTLTESIRVHGQQVPILVRPHPEHAGRYQVAYGHRRLRALIGLGRLVKAVVRELRDEELVIAQGQENNERQDLSYIEKARFAHRLQDRFNRETIMTAMSVYKSDLSNMLSVVARIPEDIIDAIGPAPGVGRRGWIELADHLATKKSAVASVRAAALDERMQALSSDERFKRVLATLKSRPRRSEAETWSTGEGQKLARVVHDDQRVALTIDRRVAPDFADFVMSRLRTLFEEHQAKQSTRP